MFDRKHRIVAKRLSNVAFWCGNRFHQWKKYETISYLLIVALTKHKI